MFSLTTSPGSRETGLDIDKEGHTLSHSSDEPQRPVQMKDKILRHPSTYDVKVCMPALSDTAVHSDGMQRGKKRKITELLDVAEASKTLATIRNRMALHEAKGYLRATLEEEHRFPETMPRCSSTVSLENNVIDVITRHEDTVKVVSRIKEASRTHMNTVRRSHGSFPSEHHNHAPEIITRHKEMVGRTHHSMPMTSYNHYAELNLYNMSREKLESQLQNQ